MVKGCPALSAPYRRYCTAHLRASTVKGLGIAQRACKKCRRTFKATDYILTEPGVSGYQHVRCEPPSQRLSKRAQKEAVKPLLDVL